jgi:hypothetical protein
VLLAGLEAPDTLVADLAGLLRARGLDEVADTLESALADGTTVVTLEPADRDAILRALEDCPYGLAELESVVLLQSTWGPEPALAPADA